MFKFLKALDKHPDDEEKQDDFQNDSLKESQLALKKAIEDLDHEICESAEATDRLRTITTQKLNAEEVATALRKRDKEDSNGESGSEQEDGDEEGFPSDSGSWPAAGNM